jgi:hypothetical protein
MNKKPPKTFKPLLWSFRWNDIDVQHDKEDIIVNTINEGNLKQWRWITKAYGKRTIRRVLKKRLASEFHPESLNLARILFSLSHLNYARKGTHTKGGKTLSSAR